MYKISFMLKNAWKPLSLILILYTIWAGMIWETPRLPILNETIRNLYFHVPMWFGMIIILLVACIYSIMYLNTKNIKYDIYSNQMTNVGILFGILGLVTGMIWAKYTWGEMWSGDAKQKGSAWGLFIYFVYLILRYSVSDPTDRAKFSSVYNILAYLALVPLLFIFPRMQDSLHPGNGGNPGFNSYDLDSRMRMIFYPAVIGWTLLGVWLATLRARLDLVREK